MFTSKNGKKVVIGLVHLKPLPATPLYKEGDLEESIEKALKDTQALMNGGAHGCLLQSVDRIYPSGDDTDYARVSGMTTIAHEVRKLVGNRDFKIGVQLMWNCITPSLAIAKVTKADFTRCTALVGTTDSPFGVINANPYKVQSYRRNINAMDVKMIAEIQGYHFKGEYDRNTLVASARSAMMVGGDAVEVLHPDEELNNKMVHDIKTALPSLPVILGGGTDLENAARRMKEADGVLVGSCFEGGKWGGFIDESIVKEYMGIIASL
ncbi:MAG: BtpA/SgcQ family protein [Peptostreptococcales bacterium]